MIIFFSFSFFLPAKAKQTYNTPIIKTSFICHKPNDTSMTSTRHLTATRMICVLHNTGCSFTYWNIDYWPVKMSAHSQWNIHFVCLCDFIPTCRSQLGPLLYLSHCWTSATDSWSLLFFFQNLQKKQNLDMNLAVEFWFSYAVWTSLPYADS